MKKKVNLWLTFLICLFCTDLYAKHKVYDMTQFGIFPDTQTETVVSHAKSVNGLIFKNNKILKNTEYEPYHWNKKTILLERVTNATIKE